MSRIKMHDWDVWQTYRKDRGTPPWVKIHRNILSNPKWAALTDGEKGQLISMWVVAADSDGALPSSPALIRKMCQLDNEPDVQRFIDLGWCETDGCHNGVKVASSGCQPDAPETETETETELPPKSPKGDWPGFDDFWSSYPCKVGKPKALTAWNRLKPDVSILMAGLNRWKASDQWTKDKGCFVPHPTTWLNREGWNDVAPGEKAIVPIAEAQTVQKRLEEAQQEHQRRMAEATAQRRKELGLTA